MAIDLSVFTRAGLSQREIGNIVGVSRNTASLWMREKRDPHFLVEDRVIQTLATTRKAVEAGDLPLLASIPRDERMERIRDILKKHS